VVCAWDRCSKLKPVPRIDDWQHRWQTDQVFKLLLVHHHSQEWVVEYRIDLAIRIKDLFKEDLEGTSLQGFD
jgi:site-specific recombinase